MITADARSEGSADTSAAPSAAAPAASPVAAVLSFDVLQRQHMFFTAVARGQLSRLLELLSAGTPPAGPPPASAPEGGAAAGVSDRGSSGALSALGGSVDFRISALHFQSPAALMAAAPTATPSAVASAAASTAAMTAPTAAAAGVSPAIAAPSAADSAASASSAAPALSSKAPSKLPPIDLSGAPASGKPTNGKLPPIDLFATPNASLFAKRTAAPAAPTASAAAATGPASARSAASGSNTTPLGTASAAAACDAKGGTVRVRRDHSGDVDVLSALLSTPTAVSAASVVRRPGSAAPPSAPGGPAAAPMGQHNDLSPLSLAVLDGDVKIVELLIGPVCRASVEFASRGRTPLLDACQGRASDSFDVKRQTRSASVVAALLAAGASVHVTDPKSGFTPLHIAAVYARALLIPLLLGAGADPYGPRDRFGRTAFDIATATPAASRDSAETEFVNTLTAQITALRTRLTRKISDGLATEDGLTLFRPSTITLIASFVI